MRLVLLAAAAALLAAPASAVEIIAHRGASRDAPENTLPAIKLGFERGADAVEIDIFLTKDGRIVVSHDETTKRTTGVDLRIAETTLAELRRLDAGSWKHPRFAGTKIPTLAEVLAAVPEGRGLVIEIKCGREVLPELERVIEASGKRSRTTIIAFSYEVIRAAKARMGSIPCYWLYGFGDREKRLFGDLSVDDLVKKAKRAGVDGMDVNFRGLSSGELADKLARESMRLWVYTVNSPEDGRRMVEMGVEGITTDRPLFMREKLGLGAGE